LGLAYTKMYQYNDAAIYFEKALEIHKKWGTNFRNPFIYHWLGRAYHKINEHKKEKEVYELGLSIFPDHPRIIQHQAICALSMGNTDKADDFITKYKSIRKNKNLWPESRILSGVGNIYEEANLFDKAELSYRQGLTLDPGNPSRMYDLARLLIDNDINVNEGVDLIQKALESRPDNWYYLDTKGWGLYKQGRYAEALKVLTDAWDLRPRYDHEGYLHIQEVEKALTNQNN
ncbi:MAG: tetratricopeptide repeat protein, partial [Bacteroidota bacterium]|nr:tetratricopeptide repeat protein [Bacteroidota bacterium]